MATDDALLSPAECADLLAVSRRSTYRWVTSGKVKAVKVGRSRNAPLRIPASELAGLLTLPREARGRDEQRP